MKKNLRRILIRFEHSSNSKVLYILIHIIILKFEKKLKKMTDNHLETFFKETLKKSTEGDLYNFDLWLQKNGVNPKKLKLRDFDDYFLNNSSYTIGFKDYLGFVARIIGSYIQDQKKLYHIPIIGIKGSGKTLFSRIIERFVDNSGMKIGASINTARELNAFAWREGEEPYKPDIYSRKEVRIIDSCEKKGNILAILKGFHQFIGPAVYITTWTPEAWFNYEKQVSRFLPYDETLVLSNFNEQTQQMSFFSRILKIIMLDQSESNQFPDFIDKIKLKNNIYASSIYQFTKGNPLLIIRFLLLCLEEIFRKNKEKLDQEIIHSVAKNMDLLLVTKRMKNLSNTHLKILSVILINNYNRGTSQKQIVDSLKLAKSTISYHINDTLTDKSNILQVKKEGKYSYYKVKENLIPFIQEKIFNQYLETKGKEFVSI